MWTTRASVVSHCMCCRQVAAYMLVAVGCIRLRWQVFILSRDPWKMTAFYSGWRFHNLLHPTSIYYHMKIWIMIPSRLMLTLGFGSVEKCQAVKAVVFPGANVAGIWLPCLAPKWDWVCEGPVQGCVNDSFIQDLGQSWRCQAQVWQAWLQSACQSGSRFLSVKTTTTTSPSMMISS